MTPDEYLMEDVDGLPRGLRILIAALWMVRQHAYPWAAIPIPHIRVDCESFATNVLLPVEEAAFYRGYDQWLV